MPAKRSKVEIFKEESNFLRYPLLDDLKTPEANVSAASEQLIKFHGSYMQENREDRKGGGGRSWQFMMRTKQVRLQCQGDWERGMVTGNRVGLLRVIGWDGYG